MNLLFFKFLFYDKIIFTIKLIRILNYGENANIKICGRDNVLSIVSSLYDIMSHNLKLIY